MRIFEVVHMNIFKVALRILLVKVAMWTEEDHIMVAKRTFHGEDLLLLSQREPVGQERPYCIASDSDDASAERRRHPAVDAAAATTQTASASGLGIPPWRPSCERR